MNIRLLFLFIAMIGLQVYAQTCPICTVDETVHTSTGPEDVGLVPDVITVQAGVDTTLTVQYLMPTQLTVDAGPPIGVVTATVTGIQILDIIDLPPNTQLTWTCDQVANACNYNPQNYRYGCVNLCINTLASAGTYSANVLVNGCGTAAGITQCQNELIPMTIVILPPEGNPFFSMSANLGCDSVYTEVEETLPEQLPINPVTYDWDFGGQAVATGATASHTFIGAGEYEITLTETIEEYYISAVSVTASDNSCYCGDVEEVDWPFVGCTAAPEPYVIINAGGGNITLGNNSSNATQNWNNIDIPLTNNGVNIQVWEEDNGTLGSPDDDLGSDLIIFNSDPGVGVNLFNTGGCATGSFTLSSRLLVTTTYVDTVTVLPPSVEPVIANLGSDTFCIGDSTTLESTVAGSYQWFESGTAIQGATNQTLVVYDAGSYSVEVIDAGTICPTLSTVTYDIATESIVVPVIQVDDAGIFIDNVDNDAVQWFTNGVPIPGANGDTLADLSSGGPFTVQVTSDLGCEALSVALNICLAGTSSGSGSEITTSTSVDFTASGFSLNPGNDIAWAVSSSADGPITDMASLQDAIDAGLVFPSDSNYQINLGCGDLDVENGDYFITPISAASLVIDSLIYNPDVDSNCIPDALLCLEITGTDWALLANSLVFTFPDGQSVGVLEALVPPDLQGIIPDTILPDLLALLPQFLPDGLCFQLFDLYQGDPNGTWSISATNVGTGAVTVSIPPFTSTVLADSCPLATADQIVNIPGTTGSIGGGQSNTLSFVLPPIPEDFPTINADCNVFGDATAFSKNCPTSINNQIAEGSFNLFPNPNNGLFTVNFEMLEAAPVQIQIFDIMGRVVLERSYNNSNGYFTETFDLKNNLSSGFYVFSLKVNNNRIQRQFIVD